MFKINDNKGFHLVFPNGITLSTQIGGGNYCANKEFPIGQEKHQARMESLDCELAVWGRDREWITKEMHKEVFGKECSDDVMGWVEFADLLKVFEWCKNKE